jgi:hypothetical protein
MRGTRDSELGIVVHEDGTMVDTTMNGVPTKVRKGRGRGKRTGKGERRSRRNKEENGG